MTYALIADIHGNRPAFEAVLKDAAKHGAACYVLAGDYVFDMPYANEVTACLQGLPKAHIVRGNKEGYLSKLEAENPDTWTSEQLGALYRTYRELTPRNRAYCLALPEALYVDLPSGGQLYVTHCFPPLHQGEKSIHSSSSTFRRVMEEAPFTRAAFLERGGDYLAQEVPRAVFGSTQARVVVSGHTHMQWHGTCGDVLVINPGSCGQPLDFDIRAPYTLLHDDGQALRVEERRVAYDVEALCRDMENTDFYRDCTLWRRLLLLSLRTAKDPFGIFFALARSVACERNEEGQHPFSNECWRETGSRFFGDECQSYKKEEK